jgi:riboflavin kinase/FMN adenylyltransferase
LKIWHELPSGDAYAARRADAPIAVAIGFFDGMHRGHRAILRALLAARAPGGRTGVLTFRNHPTSVLRPETAPPLIATLEERVNAIARQGVDELFLVPFDAAMAAMEPLRFLDDVVLDTLRASAMVVGANFRFGAKRAGDTAFARAHLAERGVALVDVPNLMDGADRVSSTRIRAALAAGDMATVDALLGASYELRGRVELGFGRGHDLGFPTANIRTAPEKTLPPDGVYATTARHDGRDYRGLVSIGTNPTFAGTARTVEAWLRDFRGALYGEELVLRELRFVRGQQKFASVDALLAQMRADVAHVPYPSFASPRS